MAGDPETAHDELARKDRSVDRLLLAAVLVMPIELSAAERSVASGPTR